MIKHIVMWKLKDNAAGHNKAENMSIIKESLEALPAKINVIKELEVGFNFNPVDFAYDVALYSVFASKEDLNAYQIHPDHVKLKDFITEVRQSTVVVDYSIE